MARVISTNDEKGDMFGHIYFPTQLADDQVPVHAKYPDWVCYKFRLTMTQLCHCIARLRPYKAPGEDGIPNVVIKESFDLIAEHLLRIFQAMFTLGTYSDRWRVWDTIVLHKLGKP